MKKHSVICFVSCLLFCSLLLSACGSTAVSGEPSLSADAQIAELMRQLDALRQSEQQQDEEYRLLLEELQTAMEKLAAQESKPSNTTEAPDGSEPSTDPSDPSAAEGRFTYTTDGEHATITGFSGKEDTLVIPSRIDGYTVVAIGESAFSSGEFTQIVLSDGITAVDWFAFYGCSSLSSVTIPASVTSIGYGAFDGCSKGLTLLCQADSYALAYAKSYGLSYTLI